MCEWFAAHLVKEGYLLIDAYDLAKIWQKTRWSFVCVRFDDWQKSVGKECRFIDLDGWQTADSDGFADMAERRKIEAKTRRRNVIGKPEGEAQAPMYVLFDAWYAGESLLNLLNQFGWQYITRAREK